MSLTQIYAVVIGGIFCALLLLNGLPWIAHSVRYLSPLISKHMFYRYSLRRHRLVGPWSRAGVLLQLIYVAGNITCISLGVSPSRPQTSTMSQAGLRAGTLSIVNLIPLFAGPHLGSFADLLGVNLSTIRQILRSAGVMAVLLAVFHTLVAIGSRRSFGLDLPQNLFAVIVSVELLRHISPLTVSVGSIFAGMRSSAFNPCLSQTLLQTLPPCTPCIVDARCLCRMVTPAHGQAVSPLLLVRVGWAVSVPVHCPRRHHLLPEWFLPVWPSASRGHAGIRCCQTPHTMSEAA